jgi:hypothetical protein
MPRAHSFDGARSLSYRISDALIMLRRSEVRDFCLPSIQVIELQNDRTCQYSSIVE